jgi:hypothetical protein
MATNTFTFEEALQQQEPETFSFEDALGTATAPTEEPREPDGFLRQAADIPVGVAMGAARGVRAISDVFGAENPLSRSIQGVEQYLDGLLSAQAKEDQQEIGRIMQEAEDKGLGDQVRAALKAFTVAPVDLMSQALGTAIPAIAGGLYANALKYGARGVGAVTGGIGAAMGTGIVKGEIYEAVKDGLADSGLSEEAIEATAQQAQSYGGENLDQIALGGLLGFVAARTGLETALIPKLTGDISKKLAKKGFGRFTQTVAGEAITEAAQGGQEQFAQNVAQQRVGLDVPTWRGVAGQATLEGVTGGGLGAGVSMVTGDPNVRPLPETRTPERIAPERRQQLEAEQQTADYMRGIEEAERDAQGALPTADTDVQAPPTGIPTLTTPAADRSLTKQSLVDIGLPANAAYTKKLTGLDLNNPSQREQASKIIADALRNPLVRAETKNSLRALYDGRISPPATDGQRVSTFDVESTVQPLTQITDTTFDELGIGKTAIIRRSEDIRNADLTTPEGRSFIRQALEAYRDSPNKSETIQSNIDNFLARLPADEEVIVQPDTEAVTEGVPDVAPTTEPSIERPAGEPSLGVVDMGDGPAPAQAGTPGAVPEVGTDGLAAAPRGTPRDVSGAPTADAPLDFMQWLAGRNISPTDASQDFNALEQQWRDEVSGVTEPEPTLPSSPENVQEPGATPEGVQAPEAAQSSAIVDDNLAELARRDDIEFDDVAAAALNAQIEGRITPEDAQMVVQSESAQEALTALEIALESNRNDVVRAVDASRAVGESAGAVSDALRLAIGQNDVRGALEAIVNDTMGMFNSVEQLIARRILDSRAPLPTIVSIDSLGTDASGLPILGQYNSITDEITLVKGTEDSHTFLHELTHAFVHRTIIEQQQTGARNPAFRDLQAVFDHVLEARPELATEYGLSSLTEFAAEIMSNRDFQMQMMGVPYQNTSVFSWFARTLRTLFGLDSPAVQQHALFAGIVAVDGLMRDGRSFQLDTLGQRIDGFNMAYAVQNVDTPLGKPLPRTFAEVDMAANPVVRSELRKFTNAVSQADTPLADIVRQQTVDIFAPIARKISAAFSEGVRSQFGDVNPTVWLRQAEDGDRVALQVFRKGGLRMTKDGLWEAYELKNNKGENVSPERVINITQALAEKQGMSYPEAKARVGTLLESMRLKELRSRNNAVEQLALEQSKAGDLDAAYRTRKDKIPLHKTNAEIDADVAVFNATPEVQQIQQIMNDVRSNIIDAMVLSGRISKDRAAAWKEAANYVPFDRFKDMLANPGVVFTPGRRGIGMVANLPQLRGSFERPVTNTVDNFMKKIASMTKEAMRTAAVTRTLDYMVDAGMARRISSPSDADNNLFVAPVQYKNGQPAYYELQNQYDLAAFVGAPEVESSIIKGLGFVSRTLRTTITATPMFSIKQVIDDSQRVVFNSGVERPLAALGRTLYNFPRIWWAQAFGSDHSYMRRMEALGIAGEFDYNPINPLATLEADTRAVPRSPIRALIHFMEQGARASDMAARLAVYEQTMRESGNMLLAQQRARELINFNRRGSSKGMRSMVHVVPFFNSYAQGLDLLYRGMTGVDAPSGMELTRARNMFMGRVAMLTGLGMIYAMSMQDDEYYKELTDDVRDRNWILPKQLSDGLGLEQPLKFTVPNEFGFFFKSIPERVVQYMNDAQRGEQREASEVVMDAISSLGSEYFFMPIPAAFRPILENSFNYSTFTGRPLVPANLKNAPKNLQYTAATSEIAKALGKSTGQSPILIDNAIRGYFGMAGGAVSVVADSLMNPSRPDRGPEQIPFLSIGLVAPVGTRSKNEFFDFRNKVTEAVVGARETAEREPENYDNFVRRNAHLMEAAPFINNYMKRLERIRAARKSYENDIYMSGAEKREKLLELQRLEIEAIEGFRELRADTLRKKP